jgi:multicomponent Na+:H+ antiporter subunit E
MMTKALGLLVALFALWLALSGYFKPFLLTVGVLSCLFTLYLARRMNLLDDEAVPLQLRLTLPLYWSWLGGEIFKSALAVSKVILSRDMPISQQFIAVESPLKTDMGHVIFANSITLTPGTVTVEAAPGKFLVHALTDEAAGPEGFAEMARRVAVVETR